MQIVKYWLYLAWQYESGRATGRYAYVLDYLLGVIGDNSNLVLYNLDCFNNWLNLLQSLPLT
jgi:hypothetical protein